MQTLRRFTWWSLTLAGAAGAAVAAPDLVRGEFSTPNRLFLAAALVGAVVQRARFLGYVTRGVPYEFRGAVEQILTCTAAVLVWAHASQYSHLPTLWSVVPAVVGGASVVSAPPAIRWRLAGGLLVVTAATGATALSWERVTALPVGRVTAVSVVVVTTFVLVDLLQVRFWDLIVELDRARAAAGELAVARERLRFAADLHDIQGHHLQSIILKGQLAERLVGKDDEGARRHTSELTELARAALAGTREVVHGYRSASLSTEVANVVELLEAAGIELTVHGVPSAVPPPLQQLFGALVREGTTNILRHSDARHCDLFVAVRNGRVELRLCNDGSRGSDRPPGSGIAGLRERFAMVGGDIVVSSSPGGRFEVTGTAGVPGEVSG